MSSIETRTCSKCGEEKPSSHYYIWQRRGRTVVRADCKPCARESSRRRTNDLSRARLGLSCDDFDRLVALQDGLCAICEGPLVGKTELSVDHDHETGAVRGLLCDLCNRAIGMMQDDPGRLIQAAAYLMRPAA